jgi:Nucleotidyl transferase AbiEii toxin, Type IV TA system
MTSIFQGKLTVCGGGSWGIPMPEKRFVKGFGLLTSNQQEFLALFSELPDQSQFYLTGGTALAEYYLGHRLSYDLDLFTGVENLIIPTSYQIETICREKRLVLKVVRRFSSFVEFLLEKDDESLKIDLALDSPYRLKPFKRSPEGVFVNSYIDLRVDKLLAYYGRTEPRDAVDLYFILQKEPPEPLMEQAAQKDPGFDLYWFAIALNRCEAFPDEIERWPVRMLKPFDPLVLKKFFIHLAMQIMSNLGK